MANLAYYQNKVDDLLKCHRVLTQAILDFGDVTDQPDCRRYKDDLTEKIARLDKQIKAARSMLELKTTVENKLAAPTPPATEPTGDDAKPRYVVMGYEKINSIEWAELETNDLETAIAKCNKLRLVATPFKTYEIVDRQPVQPAPVPAPEKRVKLTPTQRETLKRLAENTEGWCYGGRYGEVNASSARSLVSRGLAQYHLKWDENTFEITDAGRNALAPHKAQS